MIKGQEAMAIVSLMLFVESLQVTIKAAMKQDEDSHERLISLTEMVFLYLPFLLSSIVNYSCQCSVLNSSSHLQILDADINKSLVKSIQDVIDDDGSIKDTAVWSLHLDSTFLLLLVYVILI